MSEQTNEVPEVVEDKSTHFIQFQESKYLSRGFTPDGTLPKGAVACAQDLYDAAGSWTTYENETISVNAPPELLLEEKAALALTAGLTVFGETTEFGPATFSVDPSSYQNIALVVGSITAEGNFPGGQEFYPMKDVEGTWHQFSPSQYKAVAQAIAAYAAPLLLIMDGNPSNATTLPEPSVQIPI